MKNVRPINIAAWNENTQLELYTGDTYGHHSLKKDFGRGSIMVLAKRLDDLLSELKVRKVDLIKIDVEGAELEVLLGLKRTLIKFEPIIIMEVKSENKNKVMNFMNENGYIMIKIAPEEYYKAPVEYYKAVKNRIRT